MDEEYNYEDTRSDTTRKGYSEKKVLYGADRRFPLLEILDALNPPKKPGLLTGAPTILPGRWDPKAMKSIESFWNGLKSLKIRLSGGKATSGILTKPGTAPTTFNGLNIRYIESPSGGLVSHKFYTELGSEYILTKDGFARRIKSPHNNVLGENSGPVEWNAKTSDAGLHNWNEGTTIFTEGKDGEIFNLAFDKLSDGFKRGTYGLVKKGGDKVRIMLVDPKTSLWREAMLSDVYPTTVKQGLLANKVLEATYSDVPKLGWHILEKTKGGWHPGSPVVYIEKQGGKMNIVEKFKKGHKIHIKKENRGKFTEYCGGKVTSECIARGKNSSDPAVRKRATFAANARKWKHKSGGPVFRFYGNNIMDTDADAYKYVKKKYKLRGAANGTKLDLINLGSTALNNGMQLFSGLKQADALEKQLNSQVDLEYLNRMSNATNQVSNQYDNYWENLVNENALKRALGLPVENLSPIVLRWGRAQVVNNATSGLKAWKDLAKSLNKIQANQLQQQNINNFVTDLGTNISNFISAKNNTQTSL